MSQSKSLAYTEFRPLHPWTTDQLVLSAVSAIVIGVVMILILFVLPGMTSGQVLAFAPIILLILSLGVIAGFMARRVGPISIENGVIHLPYRIKGRHGRTRDVPIAGVLKAQPTIVGGSRGVWLTTEYGIRVLLEQHRFGVKGFELLERLCQAVGTSYVEAIKRELLEGTEYGIRTLRVKELDGDSLVLRRKFTDYNRRRRRLIQPQDVISVEEVNPSYTDPGYLLILQEGSFVLLRMQDVTQFQLLQSPKWAELLSLMRPETSSD